MVLTKKSYAYTKGGRAAFNAKKKTTYKSKALTQPEKKQVARIAKKVLMSNVEHKYKVVGFTDRALTCNTVWAINPLGNITLGTTSYDRIGEKINNLTLRFKASWISLGQKVGIPYTHLWNRAELRVMIVRTKRQITNAATAWADITNNVANTVGAANRDQCMFYQPDSWAYPYHVGLQDTRKDNDYHVVYDKIFRSDNDNPYTNFTTGDYVPNGKFINIKFTYNIGKVEYEESNTAYQRKGFNNVYILVCPYIPMVLAGTDVAGDLTGHYSLSWTDA